MPSLRQYASAQQILDRIDSSIVISDKLIDRAERLIDSMVAEFYEGAFAKFAGFEEWYGSEKCTFTATSLVIDSDAPAPYKNIYQYCVIEILDGTKKGLRMPVTGSDGWTLTFPSQSDLSGAFSCKVWQLGKFPMVADCELVDTTYLKSIPELVVEAVAFQAEFLTKNGISVNQPIKQSESIGQNYSYTLGKLDQNSTQLYSPIAYELLSKHGLTVQSWI